MALIGVKEKRGRAPLVENADQVWATVTCGLKLLTTNRKAMLVMLTRMINSIPTHGMAIFFPALFTDHFNWSVGQFLLLTTVIYAVNIPCNLLIGWIGDVFGIGLAGFVPLSAMAISLAPKHPGAAMTSYNLGIGAAVFAGPLLVALLYGSLGTAGMVYLFSAPYVVAGIFTYALRGSLPGFDGVPALAADVSAAHK